MKSKIALVTCVKEKQAVACSAQDLYQGELFARWMEYAKQHADSIYILSGKHNLLELTDVIEPYDVNLNNATDSAVRRWSDKVIAQLAERHDIAQSHFIVIANPTYYRYLLDHFKSYEIPFKIE